MISLIDHKSNCEIVKKNLSHLFDKFPVIKLQIKTEVKIRVEGGPNDHPTLYETFFTVHLLLVLFLHLFTLISS